MEVKSDVINDIISAKMAESFATFEVLIEPTFFGYKSFKYFFLESQ